MSALTERQQSILDFILSHSDEKGYPPTRGEIASEFGMSINAAQTHLQAIEKKGGIKLIPNISRGIVVNK